MNISLNWLRDYLSWEGSSEELSEVFTEAGIKVEHVRSLGIDIPKVVVAQIIDSQPHPNADRLRVCRVKDGSEADRQIVCGAKNYQVGDKVPLALPGAILPGDFKIKVGKLRGVESEGMMCSGRELGISEDAEGLLILDSNAVVGSPISSIFPADVEFELEITPNRSDWLSHVGIAREVAAMTGSAIKLPSSSTVSIKEDTEVVRIDATEACPFYSLRKILNVKVGPSPDWLCRKLEAVGLRPINNIVDITNFVMFEGGQPLHAFDAAKVSGAVIIREAREGEKLTALNGLIYELGPRNLVIADEKKVLALAGIMGGEESGVTESTTEVLLESAFFEPSGIRRTTRSLQLSSDASYRFEREVDLQQVVNASTRAVDLISEIVGGSADTDTWIAGSSSRPVLEVTLRQSRCNDLLGLELQSDYLSELLTRVGCILKGGDHEVSRWTAPSYRHDLLREVDLIEEVARLHGMEQIPVRTDHLPVPSSDADRMYDFLQGIRKTLAGRGFLEGRTSALVGSAAGREGMALRNPMGEEQSCLRPSLLPGLLEALARNLRHGAESVRLFEIGRVFHSKAPEERTDFALTMTGSLDRSSWRGEASEADIFVLKGLVKWLLPDIQFVAGEEDDAVLVMDLILKGQPIGKMGQLSHAKATARDARLPIVYAEWNLDLVRHLLATEKTAQFSIPRFPAMTRDIAVVVPKTMAWSEIESVMQEKDDKGEQLLTGVKLFDIFIDPTGEKLPMDKKSIAFSLTFRSAERTLETEEVHTVCDRIKQRLRDRLGAEFRT